MKKWHHVAAQGYHNGRTEAMCWKCAVSDISETLFGYVLIFVERCSHLFKKRLRIFTAVLTVSGFVPICQVVRTFVRHLKYIAGSFTHVQIICSICSQIGPMHSDIRRICLGHFPEAFKLVSCVSKLYLTLSHSCSARFLASSKMHPKTKSLIFILAICVPLIILVISKHFVRINIPFQKP